MTNGRQRLFLVFAAFGLVRGTVAQDTASRVISGAVLDPTDRGVPAATLKLARREAKGQAKVNATAVVINEMKLTQTATKAAAKKTRKKAEATAPTLAGWEEPE